ncbi:hypothetical protein R1flu_028485 [Riccia fluitans]|uniref:Uncharacterized protein n=1 Tax=Riccia fluitans TaxID=41844 RepID=A0ABD1XLW7_9MARC
MEPSVEGNGMSSCVSIVRLWTIILVQAKNHGKPMNLEERRKADLPMSFEDEHLRILDSFMKDKVAQNLASIADSSIFPESNVDDSDELTGKEAQLNGKCKRPVGESTKFIVAGMRDSMRELGEIMTRLEADRLLVEKQIEQERIAKQTCNCNKICDVLRFLAGALNG